MRAKIRAESENTLLRERLDAHEEQMSKVLKEMEELKKSANFTRPVEQNNNHGSPSPMEMQDMNIPSSNSPIQDINNYASNSPMQNMRGQSDDSGARSIVNENRIPHSEIIQKKVAARNVGNEIIIIGLEEMLFCSQL